MMKEALEVEGDQAWFRRHEGVVDMLKYLEECQLVNYVPFFHE